MSYFSELLSYYSKRIGVNSPQIASYCNLDRVTVYRFIKGKTLPKDKKTVDKMAVFLQLTTDEKATLTEAYECTRLGPHVYWERRYIRSFIKSFSMTSFTPSTPSSAAPVAVLRSRINMYSGFKERMVSHEASSP